MCVGLFIPYFTDRFSLKVGIVMVKVSWLLNVKVDFPLLQIRCGQPTFNSNYWDKARQRAKRCT
jgi:Fe-S oxidoreductase